MGGEEALRAMNDHATKTVWSGRPAVRDTANDRGDGRRRPWAAAADMDWTDPRRRARSPPSESGQ